MTRHRGRRCVMITHGDRMSRSNSGSLPNCVTLGKLLNLSGFQFSHLQVAHNNSSDVAGLYRSGRHVCKVIERCLDQGRTRTAEGSSILTAEDGTGRQIRYACTRSISSSSICVVIPMHVTLCCTLGTEQQTKMPPRPPSL